MSGLRLRTGFDVISLAVLMLVLPARGQVTSEWLNPVSGLWDNPTLWTTDPYYPQNGQPDSGAIYDVLIDAAGSPYTITCGLPVVLNHLLIDSPDATLTVTSSGNLQVTDGIDLQQGTLYLSAGDIFNTHINVAAGAQLQAGSGVVLTNVVLSGDLFVLPSSGTLTLAAGFSFDNGSIHFDSNSTGLAFSGLTALNGTGEVVFDGGTETKAITVPSGNLTIGPNVTIRTGTGSGRINTSSNRDLINQGTLSAETSGRSIRYIGSISNSRLFVNEGLIRAVHGGELELEGVSGNLGQIEVNTSGKMSLTGSYTIDQDIAIDSGGTLTLTGFNNQATIYVNSGTLNIGDNTLLSSIGNLVHSGGTVNVIGEIMMQGGTLQLDANTGTWNLVDRGELSNGTIAPTTGGAELIVKDRGYLSNVVNQATIRLEPGALLYIDDVDNQGMIDVGTGQLGINTYYGTDLGDLSFDPGGRLFLNGNWELQGQTLDLPDPDMTLYIYSGRVSDGRIDLAATAPIVSRSGTFENVTLANDITTASADGGHLIGVRDTLTLDNATIYLGHEGGESGTLNYATPETLLTGTGQIISAAGSGITTTNNLYGKLTIDSGITIRAIDGDFAIANGTSRTYGTVINHGHITMEAAGKKFTTLGSFTNAADGLIEIGPQSTFSLGWNWNNEGAIVLDNARLELNGVFVPDDIRNIQTIGDCQVYVTGEFDLQGTTFNIDDCLEAQWGIARIGNYYPTVSNGTLTSNGSSLSIEGSYVYLDQITLALDTVLNDAIVQATSDLTLDDVEVTLRSSGLFFYAANNPHLSGTGLIHFAQDTNNTLNDNGVSGDIVFGAGIDFLADTGSGFITFSDGNTIINGELHATNHQSIDVGPGHGYKCTLGGGGLIATEGGRLTIGELLGNVGPVALDTGGILELDGDYIIDHNINLTNDTRLTLAGNWAANAAINVDHATIEFEMLPGPGDPITLNHARVGLMGDFTHDQVFDAFDPAGQTFYLTRDGTLDNTGRIITLGSATGYWEMRGGTMTGGSIVYANGPNLVVANAVNTFSNVQFQTDIDILAGAVVELADASWVDGNIYVLNDLNESTSLLVDGAGWMQPGCMLVFEQGDSESNLLQALAGDLNIPIGSMVRTGAAGGATIGSAAANTINSGDISAQTAGQTLHVKGATVLNGPTGSMAALNGGTLIVENLTGSAGVLMLDAGSTLSVSGDYVIDQPLSALDGSRLELLGNWTNTAPITIDHSTLRISEWGFGSGGLTFNASVLELTTHVTGVQLAGVVTGPDSTIELHDGSQLDLQGGSFDLDGSGTPRLLLKGGNIRNGTLTASLDSRLTVADDSSLTDLTCLADLYLPDTFTDLDLYHVTLVGARVDGNAATTVRVQGASESIFDNVTANRDVNVYRGATLRVRNGLHLNDSLSPGSYGSGSLPGRLLIDGSQTIDGSGQVLLSGIAFTSASAYSVVELTDGSTLTVAAGMTVMAGGQYAGSGSGGVIKGANASLVNHGRLAVEGGQLYLQVNTENYGQVELTDFGMLTVESAQLTNHVSGIVRGEGTIYLNSGTLVNHGELAPGNDVGLLRLFGGNYEQTATGVLTIELAADAQDLLIVYGSASLDGALNLVPAGDFNPSYGESFVILTAYSISGMFAAIQGVNLSSDLVLAVTYDELAVRVTAALPGDANLDGLINLGDLQILGDHWMDDTGTWSDGDFTGDGLVNLADLQILGDQWGMSAADVARLSPVSIPEPGTFSLMLLCVLGAACHRGRPRSTVSRAASTVKHTYARLIVTVLAALLLSPALRADITTTGNVTPDPHTTTINDDLYIGQTADGSLLIDGGSDVLSHWSYFGVGAGVNGTATLDGAGSTWTCDMFAVGALSTGQFHITHDADATSATGILGFTSGSNGLVTIDGTGSSWNSSSSLSVGHMGSGEIQLTAGGSLRSPTATLGVMTGSSGLVSVDGTGSTWTNLTSLLYLGKEGQGSLSVTNGGRVESYGGVFMADAVGASGDAVVDGSGSYWEIRNTLYIGKAGQGSITVRNGGKVETHGGLLLGYFAGASGTMNVEGPGTIMYNWYPSEFYIGNQGDGTLNISDGAFMEVWYRGATVAMEAGSTGSLNVTDAGTRFDCDYLRIGHQGDGQMLIANGATVETSGGGIGTGTQGTGSVEVNGAGTTWTMGGMTVADEGQGDLTISGGALVQNTGTVNIAIESGSIGSVVVDGADSAWAIQENLYIGGNKDAAGGQGAVEVRHDGLLTVGQKLKIWNQGAVTLLDDSRLIVSSDTTTLPAAGGFYLGAGSGSGTLEIVGGGQLSVTDVFIAKDATSTGTATIKGSHWTVDGDFQVAQAGTGTLNIQAGGQVNTAASVIGNLAGANGTVNVTGTGASWTTTSLAIGSAGDGTLNITTGGSLLSTSAEIGSQTDATGAVTVNGAGSSWTNSEDLSIGGSGSGSLSINSGGAVSDRTGVLGISATGSGTVTVSGAGSNLSHSEFQYVGLEGAGSLSIASGGTVSNQASGYVACLAGSSGQVTVDGAGSTWSNHASLYIGGNESSAGGQGDLTIQNGGQVTVGQMLKVWDNGRITQQDNARLIISSDPTGTPTAGGAYVGIGTGSGDLQINGGGQVTSALGYLGYGSGSQGTAEVSGVGSQWSNSGALSVGQLGDGVMQVTAGGLVSNTDGYIASESGSSGSATVSGTDSHWSNSGNLYVGDHGAAQLQIDSGGQVSNSDGYLGREADSTGEATVDGTNSQWNNSRNLYVGYHGQGTLHIANSGVVLVADLLFVDPFGEGVGRINFNAGEADSGTLYAGALELHGDGMIHTRSLVSDVNLQFDQSHGPQQQVNLNGEPGQVLTIDLDYDSSREFGVGYSGQGELTIAEGVSLQSARGILGYQSTGQGTAIVQDAGSSWSAPELLVGRNGSGQLQINTGGSVNDDDGYLGYGVGSSGQAVISGAGSTWTHSNRLYVGEAGQGNLQVNAGAQVSDVDGYLGHLAGSAGEATIDGVDAFWTHGNRLYIGHGGSGTLHITNSGQVVSALGYLGYGSGSQGTAEVSGVGSQWSNSGALSVGQLGDGVMQVTAGGLVSNTDGYIASESGSSGSATVSGTDSHWSNSGNLYVGDHGAAQLQIDSGGQVSNSDGYLGREADSTGEATVDGTNSQWNNSRNLYVGYHGQGTLHIANSGVVLVADLLFVDPFGEGVGRINFNAGEADSGTLYAGALELHGDGMIHTRSLVSDVNLQFDQSHGPQQQVNLNGEPGQVLTIDLDYDSSREFGVGYSGQGELTIAEGVSLQSARGILGYQSTGQGTAIVQDAGSSWSAPELLVGRNGSGQLQINTGGSVNDDDGYLGYGVGSSGQAVISGAGSTWTHSNRLYVGEAGQGNLQVNAGAQVSDVDGYLGHLAGSAGEATIDGVDAFWTHGNRLYIGHGGSGTLHITNSGQVVSALGYLGYGSGSQGTAVVSGVGSQWSTGVLFVGNRGAGVLNISGKSAVSITDAYVGFAAGASGDVAVSGAGSIWNASGRLHIGQSGTGSLTISNGGQVSGTDGFIGYSSGVTGNVTVQGPGAIWTAQRRIYVGYLGNGDIQLSNGGQIITTRDAYIAEQPGSTGSVTVDGPESLWTNQASVFIGGGSAAAGGIGELNITNGGKVTVADTLQLWAHGTLNLTGGTLVAGAIKNNIGGELNFAGGTLQTDTLTGDLTNTGGTLSPGHSPGTLIILGNYTQESPGTLLIELDSAAHDVLAVSGVAELAGILSLDLLHGDAIGLGDTLTILTAASVTGRFDTISGMAVSPALALAVTYSPTMVQITGALPADANLDGAVNLADLQILGDNWSSTDASWDSGDLNGDGRVNLSDLQLLGDHWGAGGSPDLSFDQAVERVGVSIPEPSALILLGLGLLGLRRPHPAP